MANAQNWLIAALQHMFYLWLHCLTLTLLHTCGLDSRIDE